MLPKHLFVYTLLPVASIAHCVKQQQQPLFREQRAPFTGENGLDVVPLNETATTGILPFDVEQTVLRLGPRFANEFYANISANGDLGSCFNLGCGKTVAKEVPCIVKAIKDKNPAELLKCGVTKADLCKCVDCIPAIVRKFVGQFCKAKDEGDVEDVYNYATFYHLADADLNLQAFLGTAKKYQIKQSIELGCMIGFPCGSCKCCIGLCVDDHCVGALTVIQEAKVMEEEYGQLQVKREDKQILIQRPF